jgi:hypothetical protein
MGLLRCDFNITLFLYIIKLLNETNLKIIDFKYVHNVIDWYEKNLKL